MSEPISGLGSSIGLELSHWQTKANSKPTIGGMISGQEPVDLPPLPAGHMYLGAIEPATLPAETLHSFVELRNAHLVRLYREYSEIVGRFDFTDSSYEISQFFKRIKYPPLEQSNGKAENRAYRKHYARIMAQKYRLDSLKGGTVYGKFRDDSIAAAFLIPDLKTYLEHFAKNGSNHSSTPAEFTRDILGWKNHFERLDPIVTRFFFRPITAFLPFDTFRRHAYIVGGSGSGKSELIKLIAHHIITAKSARNYSAVIIDPHGDLAEEIARFRECENNDRIIFFDPEGSEFSTPCLDIFSVPDTEETTIDIIAGNIADAFEEIIADTSISAQMRALLIPCISVLLRRPGSSLSDLQRFMLDDANDDLIALGCQSPNSGQAQFFKSKFDTKTYAPTKASIYTRLQTLLNSTMFRRMLNPKATLDLETELNNGKIVVFSLAKSAIGNDVSGALGRFIVAQIKNIGFRRQKLPKTKRVPTFVFIDECQNYIGESIEIALTELRKYGIHMILANQVLGQNMSTQLEKIILANTAVKFAGYNGEASHVKMAKEMNVDIAELKALVTGRFCCKINDPRRATSPFVFKVPSHLVGVKHGMKSESWYEQKKRGWKGYVANSELDGTARRPTPDTRPDFVDEPDEKASRPKFDF